MNPKARALPPPPPFAYNEREGREARLLPLGELIRTQGMELGDDLRQVAVAAGRALAPRLRRWLRRTR